MWLVMYGRGRGVRAPNSGGGISTVRKFDDEASAQAFVRQCRKEGLRATEPKKLASP
jgi:hypothetical protein